MAQIVETKKWYQSKLVALGGVLILVFGSNALFGWLTGPVEVTAEQIQAVEQVQPVVTDAFQRLLRGESILNLIGQLAGAVIIVVRVFFTSSLIPQSLPKK